MKSKFISLSSIVLKVLWLTLDPTFLISQRCVKLIENIKWHSKLQQNTMMTFANFTNNFWPIKMSTILSSASQIQMISSTILKSITNQKKQIKISLAARILQKTISFQAKALCSIDHSLQLLLCTNTSIRSKIQASKMTSKDMLFTLSKTKWTRIRLSCQKRIQNFRH